jgi:leucine dehydrogenase
LSRWSTYAPNYVVNAGGIINVMAEFRSELASSVEAKVLAIGDRLSTYSSARGRNAHI